MLRHPQTETGAAATALCGIVLGLFALALQAVARADAGWYVDAALGWDYARSLTLDSNDARMDFDRGVYQYAGSIGRYLAEDWRLEVEHAFLENAPEILYSVPAMLELDSDRFDDVTVRTLMINLARDFRLGEAWQPYLGIGAGLAHVDLRFSEISVNGAFIQRPRRDIINDDTLTFAVQALAGFRVPLTRRLDAAADFRFWHAPSVDLREVSGAPLDTPHTVQSLWLRLRYHFAPREAPREAHRFNAQRTEAARSDWYLSARAGGGFASDMGTEDVLTIDAFAPGAVSALAVGRHWRRLRIELEAAARRNDIEVIEFGPDVGEDAASGTTRTVSLMGNLLYSPVRFAGFVPYVGLGAGALRMRFDDTQVFGFCSAFVCSSEERREVFLDDRARAFAWQVLAGVEVALSRRLSFTADYRFLSTRQLRTRRPDGTPFRGEARHDAVLIGLRYRLGAGR